VAAQAREIPNDGRDETPVRVVLVEDHALFRAGLSQLLTEHGFAVVGEASTGTEALALVAEVDPDGVVMDIAMPGKGGIWAAHELTSSSPRRRVLMLSVSAATDDVIEAIEAGACGYLLKDLSANEIVRAVSAAARGESVLSPGVTGGVLKRIRDERAPAETAGQGPSLTARELAVLRLLVEGKENNEIASELIISVQTVKSHVSNLLEKLAVENRVQAAVAAVRNRLL
jgi:DNA-binding NarL/FixJ family response regulator